jgi:RecJ-like exonuclease
MENQQHIGSGSPALPCSLSSGCDEGDEITCWDCKGNGHVRIFHGAIDCSRCDGLGRVPKITATWHEIGKAIKRQRLARRMSMREEAERLGVNLIAYSDIERGKIDPEVIAHLLPENTELTHPETKP